MDEAVLFLLCFVIGVRCQPLTVGNGARSIDVYLVLLLDWVSTEGQRVDQPSCPCSVLGLLRTKNFRGTGEYGQG